METYQIPEQEQCLNCQVIFDHEIYQKTVISCGHQYCLPCIKVAIEYDYYFCINCKEDILLSQEFKENIKANLNIQQKLQVTQSYQQCNEEVLGHDILNQKQCSEIQNPHEFNKQELEGTSEQPINHSMPKNEGNQVDDLQNDSKSQLKVSDQEQEEIKEEIKIIQSFSENDFINFYSKITEFVVLDKMKPYSEEIIQNMKLNSDERQLRNMTTLKDGGVYLGEWSIVTNQMEGYGIHIDPSSSVYFGFWKDGKKSGKGVLIFSNGNVYDGDWSKNLANGQGTLSYFLGGKYEGQWLDDVEYGEGVHTFADGTTFIPKKKDLKMHGYQELTCKIENPIDDSYIGEYKDDKKHGYGVLESSDYKYEGNWFENVKEGKGVTTWKDGRKYEGFYVNDKFNGFGVFTDLDGSIFNGKWKLGRKNGLGKLTLKSGEVEYQMWERGSLIRDMSKQEYDKLNPFNSEQ